MRRSILAFAATALLLVPSIGFAQDYDPELYDPMDPMTWPPQPDPPENWIPPLAGVPFAGFPEGEPKLWDHGHLPPMHPAPSDDGEADEVSRPDGALMPKGIIFRRTR